MRRLRKSGHNKGETIIEVMVAFIVLLIILAIFSDSVSAAGAAQQYAAEKRAEADMGMRQLQHALYGSGTNAARTGQVKTENLSGGTLTAVQYKTEDRGCIYWVFEENGTETPEEPDGE